MTRFDGPDTQEEAMSPNHCGCKCGCHNTPGHGGRYRGCHKKADWLPEHRVWACKECLVTCDG